MNPACPACAGETDLTGWKDAYGFECDAKRRKDEEIIDLMLRLFF